MHRDDLSKVAPLWLSITEDVREDPEVRPSSFFYLFLQDFSGTNTRNTTSCDADIYSPGI